MLEALITNKTRLRLLLKFFLNSTSKSYLRNLETEFDESTNAIRIELNRFEKAGLLSSSMKGNRKMFQANTKHPLYPDLNNILRKYVGFDQIIEKVVHKLGGVKKAYITGELAKGNDTNTISLILTGDNIDETYLERLSGKTSELINRKITCTIVDENREEEYLNLHPEAFLIWKEI
jgi:hypothetical protein